MIFYLIMRCCYQLLNIAWGYLQDRTDVLFCLLLQLSVLCSFTRFHFLWAMALYAPSQNPDIQILKWTKYADTFHCVVSEFISKLQEYGG